VQVLQRRGSSPKRLIDGVAAKGIAQVQRGQRRGGITQTSPAYDKFSGQLSAAEAESILRLPMVLERAGDDRNSNCGPEGNSGCGRFDQNRVRVPRHEGANSRVECMGSVRWSVDPWQDSLQVATSHEPADGTGELGMVPERDDAILSEHGLDIEMKTPHI
jgi:hypothetical protein